MFTMPAGHGLGSGRGLFQAIAGAASVVRRSCFKFVAPANANACRRPPSPSQRDLSFRDHDGFAGDYNGAGRVASLPAFTAASFTSSSLARI
eukprot:tig00000180_g13621.t1